MKARLVQATSQDREIVQNLGRFYVYDMSKYCGFLSGWQVPVDGLFVCPDLGFYWEDPKGYPFLIKVEEEIAGFALVQQGGRSPLVDWSMGQFFILGKFQRRGMGQAIALELFAQFSGIWEIVQIPENTRAIDFWDEVIAGYTRGVFEKETKIIEHPKPHPMVVFIFQTKMESPSEEYKVYYKKHPSFTEETLLIEGISQEAAKARGMERWEPFAFFIKNSNGETIGGVKGVMYYGCLYVDLLWIASSYREQKLGFRLMEVSEALGRKNRCSFASVNTMDWEALRFYEKLGYAIEYTRHGYDKNSSMYFLRKEL